LTLELNAEKSKPEMKFLFIVLLFVTTLMSAFGNHIIELGVSGAADPSASAEDYYDYYGCDYYYYDDESSGPSEHPSHHMMM
jgi:hypothetical protein